MTDPSRRALTSAPIAAIVWFAIPCLAAAQMDQQLEKIASDWNARLARIKRIRYTVSGEVLIPREYQRRDGQAGGDERRRNNSGSSDQCVFSLMETEDFEFEELTISEAVGLSFHGLDFVVGAFQRAG